GGHPASWRWCRRRRARPAATHSRSTRDRTAAAGWPARRSGCSARLTARPCRPYRRTPSGSASLAAEQGHEHGGGVAAQRVREADAGAVHLAAAGIVTQLGDDLGDLGGAGGADRMALGLQTTRGIHGNLAAEAGPPLLGRH